MKEGEEQTCSDGETKSFQSTPENSFLTWNYRGGLTVLDTVFFIFTNYKTNLQMKISFMPKINITLAFWYSVGQFAQFR